MSDPSVRPSSTPARRRWPRLVLAVLLVVVLLAAVALVFLPRLAGGPAKNLVLSLISRSLDGSLQVQVMQLRWSKGQRIDGLALYAADGAKALTVETIDAPDLSLWALVRGQRDLGRIKIVAPEGKFEAVLDALSSKPSTKSDRTRRPQRPSTTSSPWSTQLEIQRAELSVAPPRVESIDVSMPRAVVSVAGLGEIDFDLNADIRQAGRDGHLDLQGKIKNLIDDAGKWRFDIVDVDIHSKISSAPTVLFDELLQLEGLLESLVGPVLNVDLVAKGNLHAMEARLDLRASRAQVQAELSGNQGILVAQPGSTVHIHMVEESWEALAKRVAPLAGTRLLAPFDIDVRLDKLSVTMVDKKIQLPKVAMVAKLAFGDVALDQPRLGRLSLRQSTIELNSQGLGQQLDLIMHSVASHGEHSGNMRLALAVRNAIAEDGSIDRDNMGLTLDNTLENVPSAVVGQFLSAYLPSPDVVPTVLGSTLNVRLSGELDPGTSPPTALLKIEVTSAQLQAKVLGKVKLDDMIASLDGSASLQLSPPTVKMLRQQYAAQWPSALASLDLAQPALVKLTISDVVLPLSEPANASGGVVVQIDQLTTQGVDMLADMTLRDVRLIMPKASLGDTLRFTGRTDVEYRGDTGLWELEGTRQDGRVELALNATRVPVPLIEQWIGRAGLLTPPLPGRIDRVAASLKSDSVDQSTYHYRLDFDAPGELSAKLSGSIAPDRVSIAGKSSAQLKLTDRTLAAWLADPQQPDEQPPWRLMQPAQVEWSVPTEAVFGLRSASPEGVAMDRIDPEATRFQFQLRASDLALQERGATEPLPYQQLSLDLRGDDLRRPIHLVLASKLSEATGSIRQGIESETQINRLYDETGHFDLEQVSFKTDTHIYHVPVDLVDRLTGRSSEMFALLGPWADIDLQGQINPGQVSDLRLDLIATNARAKIAGKVDQDLLLHGNGYVEVEVTPQSSALLLRKLNPIISAVSALQPVTARIMSEGFRYPLHQFDIAKVKADMEVDLGTLTLDRSPQAGGQALGLLVQVLSKVAKLERSQGTTHTAVFTPLKIHMDNGVISYRDMTITLDGVVLGFRGQVDLPQDRVNLILSVSGRTFASNEKIGRYFRPDDRFDIPMRGTTDQIEFDDQAFLTGLFELAAQRGMQEGIKFLAGKENAPLVGVLEGLFGVKSEGRYPDQESEGQESTAPATEAKPINGQSRQVVDDEPEGAGGLLDGILKDLERRAEEKKAKRRAKRKKKAEQSDKK